jgi:hypothetical protein
VLSIGDQSDADAVRRNLDSTLKSNDRKSNGFSPAADYDARIAAANKIFGIETRHLDLIAEEGTAQEKLAEVRKQYADEIYQAEAKYQEQLSAKREKDLENFKGIVGSFFDAAVSRQPRAIPDFIKSQGLGLARTITENAAGAGFKAISSYIPHADAGTLAGKALEGTPFGPSATALLKVSATALDGSAASLTLAAHALMGAATGRGVSGGPIGSGGTTADGGSFASDIPLLGSTLHGASAASVVPGVGFDGGSLSVSGNPLAKLASGLGLGNFGSGAASVASGYGLSVALDPGFNAATRIGAGVGLAGAGIAGAEGIYSGIKQGGVGGDLKAAGSAAGLAGGIVSNVSKLLNATGPLLSAIPVIGSIAALALPLIGGFFNGPQKRENAINQELSANQYQAPTAINATMGSNGGFTDFDSRGNIRTSSLSPYPQTTNPYLWEQTHGLFGGPPTYYGIPGGQQSQYGGQLPSQAPVVQNTYHIQAMDVQSFHDFAQRNHTAIGEAAATNLQNLHGRLSSEVQRAVSN